MSDDLIAWHSSLEKGIKEVFPGIGKVIVSSGGRCYPEDSGIAWLIDRMSRLKASELLIEGDADRMLVVKYDYGDMAAAACYENGIAPADLSRLIRLTFSGRGPRACSKPYVPAADIERLAWRWKRSIAFVFGDKFALKLVEKPFRDKDRDAMTLEDLEAARAYISSALGDCLELQKVNK